MWPLCSRPSGSCYFMAPFTEGMSVPLSMPYISLFATVSPPVFLTRSVCLFLFVSSWLPCSPFLSHRRISLCLHVSLSHRPSLHSPSIFSPSVSLSLSSSPHFHHFPCHASFSAFPPHCSIVALAVPLLIHHLLLSTDLFAKTKPLQLRDRKKMPSSLESLMAEETETDRRKLQSFELKKKQKKTKTKTIPAGSKTKKLCQRLP